MDMDREPAGEAAPFTEKLMHRLFADAMGLLLAKVNQPWAERTFAEDALKAAYLEHRVDDPLVRQLTAALQGMLDFKYVDQPDEMQKALQLDDPRIDAYWRNAMGMAIAVVDVKIEELPPVAISQTRTALDQIVQALRVAYEEGPSFKLPRKLGRYEPRSPKPPPPKRGPRNMAEALLATLPKDGTPIPRTKVAESIVKGRFAVSAKSASRAFKELLGRGEITETGVRGRTMIALSRSPAKPS